MTETTTPANVRTEQNKWGYTRVLLGDTFIGTVASVKTINGTHTTAYGVRDGWIGHHYGDDMETAVKDVVAAYRPAPHKTGEIHRETYRGVEFVVTFTPGEDTGRHDRYEVLYDGKPNETPKGDLPTIAKKVRAMIDQKHTDEELLPKLRPLADIVTSVEGFPGWDNGTAPKVGDVAWVYAMGRYRRGLVTKVAKTRATVSYTTFSSNGRVFHKAAKFTELAADPAPAAEEENAGQTDAPAWACPATLLYHDWAAGLTCRACGEQRSAADAITSALSSVPGWSKEAAQAVLAAHRAEALAEAIALLRKEGMPHSAFVVENQLGADAS